MKVLVVASFPDSLVQFRGALLDAFLGKGLQVHVAAPDLPLDSIVRQQLEAKGMVVHEVPMHRTGTNPLADLSTLFALHRLMQKLRPSHVLAYTIKPVIYGLLAARLTAVPNRFALITGLGSAFGGETSGSRGGLRALVSRLYAQSLKGAHRVFFQNPDDRNLFWSLGILGKATPTIIVNGSGIDVSTFSVVPLPQGANFLLIARLIGDKGVREYVEAARRVLAQFPDATFSLVGWIDENPDAIAQSELDAWVSEGVIRYLGRMKDVRPAISASSVFVLPSYYREGTPRTVLEAMAMGRPVITTDAPGCRETVKDGDNGFLVPVKSVDALTEAMLRLIREPVLRELMGQRSRKVAEDKYDVHKVNAVMIREMGL